jgi:hypothetical protein
MTPAQRIAADELTAAIERISLVRAAPSLANRQSAMPVSSMLMKVHGTLPRSVKGKALAADRPSIRINRRLRKPPAYHLNPEAVA